MLRRASLSQRLQSKGYYFWREPKMILRFSLYVMRLQSKQIEGGRESWVGVVRAFWVAGPGVGVGDEGLLTGGQPFLYGVVYGKCRVGWDPKIWAVVGSEEGITVIHASIGPIAVCIWQGLGLHEDLQGGITVVFDPLSLGLGTGRQLVFHGARDVQDVGNGPGVVERLHDEERIADVSDQVLGKHAHVLTLRELVQAFWCGWAGVLVAELEESGIRITEGIGLAREVQSINEDTRIGNQPILRLLQLRTQIVSPKVNSQPASRCTTEHYLTSLRIQPIVLYRQSNLQRVMLSPLKQSKEFLYLMGLMLPPWCPEPSQQLKNTLVQFRKQFGVLSESIPYEKVIVFGRFLEEPMEVRLLLQQLSRVSAKVTSPHQPPDQKWIRILQGSPLDTKMAEGEPSRHRAVSLCITSFTYTELVTTTKNRGRMACMLRSTLKIISKPSKPSPLMHHEKHFTRLPHSISINE